MIGFADVQIADLVEYARLRRIRTQGMTPVTVFYALLADIRGEWAVNVPQELLSLPGVEVRHGRVHVLPVVAVKLDEPMSNRNLDTAFLILNDFLQEPRTLDEMRLHICRCLSVEEEIAAEIIAKYLKWSATVIGNEVSYEDGHYKRVR